MIKFENCTLRTGNFYSFRNLNLAIEQGKHYRITGPNGGGKTLLVQAIAGKALFTEGTVQLNSPATTLKDLVQWVPARTFEMMFSASDNVFYQQRYYAVANRDVQTVADFLGVDAQEWQWQGHPHFDISHLRNVKLTGLSNGQLRKLVLLKSLARRPKVLVMDYPYEGLDVFSRQDLNDLLKEIATSLQCTLIIVDNLNRLPDLPFETLHVSDFKVHPAREQFPLLENALSWKTPKAATQGEPVIQCHSVRVTYGEKVVIRDFSWEVCKGERWLLSGENGSGKSTILSLLFADHPQAYRNEIYLWGRKRGSGESIWDIKNNISFLSAEMFTYASNSFKNNQKVLPFLLTHFQGPFEMEKYDVQQLQAKALNMLAFFGLQNLSGVLFRNLSSGQKQLLLIIRTMLFKRDLLLLDEPFQFLDAHHKALAKQFIHTHLHASDTLIVISHHNDEEFPGIDNCKHM